MTVLETERLILRQWREEDRAPFATMNADPEVLRFFPSTLTRAESDALFDRFVTEWSRSGRSFHAVEEKASGRFIGFVGVAAMPAVVESTATQVGWRLARDTWGRGYAPEAATAAMDAAFADPAVVEIIAYTVPANRPSIRVMEKLGLVRAAHLDFEHPAVPEGNPLRQHIVHAIGRDAWRERRRG